MSHNLGGVLRFLAVSWLVVLLLASASPAATLVFTPVRTGTVELYYEREWNFRQHPDLFLAGIRENNVAQALFELDGLDPASITSIVFRVVPDPSPQMFVEYVKLYGVAGDPAPRSSPGRIMPPRTLLYDSRPRVKVPAVFEFDLTEAILTAGLDITGRDGFRIDFTAYTATAYNESSPKIPLGQAELIVRTIPEPSTALFLLGGCGVLIWTMRRRLRTRHWK